jgi:hypothetical protein
MFWVFSSSEFWNWLSFLTIILGLGALCFLASASHREIVFKEHPLSIDQFCEQSIETPDLDSETFLIFVLAEHFGTNLCNRLISDTALSSDYGSIRAEWSLSSDELSRAIVSSSYALLQLRPEQALEAGGFLNQDYKRISYYPPYAAGLIARDSAPERTVEYLRSPRVIGLLQNPKSRSGYQIAMRTFGTLGLNKNELLIKQYPSHAELRRALKRGDVDVIGSYWDAEEQTKYPDWRFKELGGVKEGLNWFLENSVFANLSQRCSVVDALIALTDIDGDSYFSDMRITQQSLEGCDDN